MTEQPRVSIPEDASDEEAAAIVAAIELSWPSAGAVTEPEPPPRWRFAGRWWSKPVPLSRDRPY